MLRQGRRSVLEIWLEGHFSQPLITTRVLARRFTICNSPALVRQAFIDHAAALERMSPQKRHALEPLLGDALFIGDGMLWQQRRRVVAPLTHASRLGELAAVMTGCAAERHAAWAALPAGSLVDGQCQMASLAAEVITRTLFGQGLGEGQAEAVVGAFGDYLAHVGQLDLLSLLGLPDWWPRLAPPALRRAAARLHGVVDGLVAAAGASGGSSLVQAMAAAGMDAAALRSEAVTLFLAGHETTANTMAWAIYLLSQAPAAEARLVAEARGVLGGRAAGHDDLARLPFTRAVVEETLRLYPPVPMLARQAQQDLAIGDAAVRRGDIVMVVPWLLHRNPTLWDQPDAFLPERFLPGAVLPDRHAYVPFSLGPRVCTGAQFGLAEAVICLATLLQDFRLRLAPGAVVQPVSRLTLRPGPALPMVLARR